MEGRLDPLLPGWVVVLANFCEVGARNLQAFSVPVGASTARSISSVLIARSYTNAPIKIVVRYALGGGLGAIERSAITGADTANLVSGPVSNDRPTGSPQKLVMPRIEAQATLFAS